ncbi:hypothetical protein LNP18_07205 [Leuconostoc citreum]|uniref:hypothetical protein n=1 Tax=Leuconostoc citreum TaxID=33964 RepID=UPI00200A9AB4|nr:hypothetical protein [Leuconostoc citreum]MCK8605892.1 hypothetical protein [Leuconostoc citreum]
MIKKMLLFIWLCLFSCFIQYSVSANGTGTAANPYTVGTSSELTSALNNGATLSSSETLHIKLTDNISYTANDSFKIQSNVVVDGNGYSMHYTGTNYTTGTAGYLLTKNGYNVTYSNLIFGSSNYSFGQTYYGILLGTSYQANLTIHDVTYYGKNGAQPICNYNAGTIVTMTGTNNFSAIPGSYGQEFMEGANLVFGSDSITNIIHNTNDATALLWNSASGNDFNMTLQKNAKVNIQTSKPLFSYGKRLSIDMADSSQLNITNTAYDITMTNSVGSNINMAKNSSFNATGNGKFGNQASGLYTNFTTSDPSKISFENTSSTNGIFTSSPKITPTTQTAYSLDSYVNSNKTTRDASANAFNLTDSLFPSNTKRVIYYPKIIPTAMISSHVNNNPLVSEILFNSLGVNVPYTYVSTQYKIYKNSQIDGDITSSDNQSIIENSQSALYKGVFENDTGQVSQINAGNYIVYLKINVTSPTGSSSSQWISKSIEVPKSLLNITVPTNMAFLALNNDMFTSNSSYEVVNHSNFDTDFGISAISGGDSNINLVENLATTTEPNPLYLALKNTDGIEMPFVQSGKKTRFNVSPFEGSSKFNLIGQYGGAISSKNKAVINYIMRLNFTQ